MNEVDWFLRHRGPLIILLADYLVSVWRPEHLDRCPQPSMDSFERPWQDQRYRKSGFLSVFGNCKLTKTLSGSVRVVCMSFFHSEVKPSLPSWERSIEVMLCAHGVFQALELPAMFIVRSLVLSRGDLKCTYQNMKPSDPQHYHQ